VKITLKEPVEMNVTALVRYKGRPDALFAFEMNAHQYITMLVGRGYARENFTVEVLA
jgi:hypothetical protein